MTTVALKQVKTIRNLTNYTDVSVQWVFRYTLYLAKSQVANRHPLFAEKSRVIWHLIESDVNLTYSDFNTTFVTDVFRLKVETSSFQ